jgi:ABC-type sugar transport system permease subunit
MKKLKDRMYPYLLMVPAILLVLSVCFLPLINALRISLYETDYLRLAKFIGFGHYRDIFMNAENLRNILTSFVFVFGNMLVILPVAFLLALILNRRFKFGVVRTVFRSILILPNAVSWMITAFLWMWLLNPYYGPTSFVLKEAFNWVMPDLTSSTVFSMPTLILTTSWRLYPFAMLFILAGLQTIPDELFEAAKIDGVSTMQSFRYIIFPLVKNTVLVVVVLLSLNTFNHVTLILQLTGGGPANLTETLALRTFHEGFNFWHLGFASALASIIFLINVGLSFIYVRILKTESHY